MRRAQMMSMYPPGTIVDARAPMAHPELNKGAVSGMSTGNAASDWAGKFQNSAWAAHALGATPVDKTAQAATSPSSITHQVLDSILPDNPFNKAFAPQGTDSFTSDLLTAPRQDYNLTLGGPLPTLSDMAAGGQNHQQTWWSGQFDPQAAKVQAPNQSQIGQSGTQTVNPNGSRSFTSPYGSGSTTFDSTPGTRTPYIAGANGENVAGDYVAGGKFSSASAGSDPSLNPNVVANAAPPQTSQTGPDKNDFSWASAFS